MLKLILFLIMFYCPWMHAGSNTSFIEVSKKIKPRIMTRMPNFYLEQAKKARDSKYPHKLGEFPFLTEEFVYTCESGIMINAEDFNRRIEKINQKSKNLFYNNEEPNLKKTPIVGTDYFDQLIQIHHRNGVINESALKLTAQDPLIVYYAIDTDEPFMKDAIYNEVNSLKKICNRQNTNISWIVFINSFFVRPQSGIQKYMYCKNGELDIRNIPSSLQRKIDDQRKRVKVQNNISIEDAEYFYNNYPLVSGEVFSSLLDHTLTIFSPKRYSLFLQIKSHGTNDLGLTGLTLSNERERTSFQKDLIEKATNKKYEEINLENLLTYKVDKYNILGNISVYNQKLGENKLGIKKRVSSKENQSKIMLHNENNNFGTTRSEIISIISSKKSLTSLLFFESCGNCNSNISYDSCINYINTSKRIFTLFQSEGELFFTNFTWDEIFRNNLIRGFAPNLIEIEEDYMPAEVVQQGVIYKSLIIRELYKILSNIDIFNGE